MGIEIKLGLVITIPRSSGVLHPATITDIDWESKRVAVEWNEVFETKKKFINFKDIYANNPNMDSYSKTPKPKLDLFNEASFLISKKCRTSTPSLRPPKPPTKCTSRFSNNSILRSKIQQTGRFRTEFKNIVEIGSGHFATVYKAQCIKDGQYYAIKQTSTRYTSESDRQRKLQEVTNLASIPQHPNIIRFYTSWEEDDYLFIQTELCETSLAKLVERCPENKLNESRVWDCVIDLMQAIKHLHDHDLLHLDVKPDNILVSFDGVLKLGDFGILHDLKKQNNNCSQYESQSCLLDFSMEKSIESDSVDEGDSKYLASETMQGKFTKAADIFSLGITVFEIATGMDLPTMGPIYHQLRHNEIEDTYFKGLSKDLIKLIKLMMEEDYSKRPSVDDLLELNVVKSHIKTRKIKTKVFMTYDIFRKIFQSKVGQEKQLRPSPSPSSSDNNDSDKLDMSTNFDLLQNGYDSDESFHTSQVKPKKLLDIFDQFDDDEL